ncbi:hypothetical protein SHK09_01425 [Polaribacter sp. PL03]|uniref:hypothetical protein n=1 Tax=Polaribacter sp. PL03 TaxID=3088353 RepID=UPI0029CE9EE5|nr:hypothetical protein [Polaribacter sp. PL03]MDX6745436.1 hypothetical protein [Polaribacter sp. PL03]
MKILSILTILFGFSQCGSNSLVKNPPFKVEKAFYNNWVGGQPGVTGTKLEIHLLAADAIAFDSLYFQNKITKVEVSKLENVVQLIGHFSTSKRKNRDLVLDVDATKELQNTLPNIKKFPFELKDNEAIVSYKKGDKTLFYKLENINKVQSIAFPSANRK